MPTTLIPHACILLIPLLTAADAAPPRSVQAPHVTVSLISENTQIQPGTPFTVGIRFQLDEHWHVYWKNPGDSGLEPRVTWHLPEGYQAGPLQWPAPMRIPLQHLVNFGYENQVVLLTEITPPKNAQIENEVQISADIDWLICKDECIPGAATLTLNTRVSEQSSPNISAQKLFAKFRQQLPSIPAHLGWNATAHVNQNILEITLQTADEQTQKPKSVEFFPTQQGIIDNNAQQFQTLRHDGQWIVQVPLQPEHQPLEQIDGVLVTQNGWDNAGTRPAMRIQLPLNAPRTNP